MVLHLTGDSYLELEDSTSNGWDVTSAGGNPIYNVSGRVGGCVDFDGSGDYLKVGGFRLPVDCSYTGCVWMYVDGSLASKRYAFEGDNENGISLLCWTDEKYKAYCDTEPGLSSCKGTTVVYPYTNPAWHFLTTRVDVEAEFLDILVNGTSEGNDILEGTTVGETDGLNIGTYLDNNTCWMNGMLDEIHISNSTRSGAWITAMYHTMDPYSDFLVVGDELVTYNESKIFNTGSTNISGHLLIQVQYYDTGPKVPVWVVDNDTINETEPRTINVDGLLALDEVFNGRVTTNDLTHGDGTYRVYACFRDPDGDVLVCDDETALEAWYEFTVNTS